MLKAFEERYLEILGRLRHQQWGNYFEEKHHDLALLDEEIYKLVQRYSNVLATSQREGQVADLIIRRELVDKEPSVSQLRNFIDDLENNKQDIPKEIREDKQRCKLELAKRMKPDVRKLMSLRNILANQEGFDSYVDLVLDTDEVDKDELLRLLNEYLDKNLARARELIKKYQISFESWFEDLRRISRSVEHYDPTSLIENLLERLGFAEIISKVQIHYVEAGFAGFATEISAQDIRVAVAPIDSLDGLRTLFHEIGHALFYCLNKEKGLFRVLPASLDESFAVVFESLATVLTLQKDDQEKVYELMTLEYVRCAISALFEFDLWKEPTKAEELFEKHYGRLCLEIHEPELWAIDSFRSIDPVYIHNYVIGASAAQMFIDHLTELYSNDYREWGNWLRCNIYYDGRKRMLSQKMQALTRK